MNPKIPFGPKWYWQKFYEKQENIGTTEVAEKYSASSKGVLLKRYFL
jgi:hypothetical protein